MASKPTINPELEARLDRLESALLRLAFLIRFDDEDAYTIKDMLAVPKEEAAAKP